VRLSTHSPDEVLVLRVAVAKTELDVVSTVIAQDVVLEQ